jgi:CelD/BcsL family acetyltransferase involved in cellulose biosynthesis
LRSIKGKLVDSQEALAPYLAAWDGLATAAARPYCAPAWMLAWWRHAAPPKAELRIVLALEGERLVGVAPFYLVRDRVGIARYGLLAAGTCAPVEPLAEKGLEAPVAAVSSRVLAAARPAPGLITFDGVTAGSLWPESVAHAWPGTRLRAHHRGSEPVPAITLDGPETLDQWLDSKSASLRREMRRSRRRLVAKEAKFRLAGTPEEVDRDLGAFARLHYARWSSRGGSGALNPAVEAMLRDAGRLLLHTGRFRLWSVEVDGTMIGGQIALAAGGELALWLGAFDEGWSKASPSMQSILVTIEDALRRGERRVIVGPGAQEWKYRLADAEDRIESVTLVPSGPQWPLVRAALAVEDLRGELSQRLPPHVKARIKAGLRRASGGRVGR